MERIWNVGIVGAGVIGRVHAEALAGLPNARLVAVSDPRQEAGQALAAEHGAIWHERDDQVIARADVDVVVLATPSGMHAEQAIRAARAGKYVVTEKPMATAVEDADRMIGAAREAGVALAVMFQNRFTRDAVLLKRAVDAGWIGRIVLGNALVHWRRTQAYYDEGGWRGTWAMDGGGALMNQAIHTIDLLQWMAGPVASIAGFAAALTHQIEAEDVASASIAFTNGALGTIQGTTSASRDWPARIELVGTEGRAILERGRLAVWESPHSLSDEALTAEDQEIVGDWQAGEAFVVGHRRQFRAILRALDRGEPPPVTGEEARRAVAIIRGIYEASRQGTTIRLGAA
jgi:predicted dehydrogenase